MVKLKLSDVVAQTQALYAKDKIGAAMIATGAALTRPTKPEQFIVIPEDHPWRELTGLMGIPFDSIVEIAGAYDSGKSTVAGEFMVAAQKQSVYVILGDSEKKFDRTRFEKHFGGNADEILVVQSTMIRKLAGGMFKYIDVIMKNDPKAKIFLVHDSVGGSVSRARAERDIDDEKSNQPGSEAVENSDYMKHVVARMDKYPGAIALLLINQMTDRIGFGQKGQSRSGGHKISFHSSLIIELKKVKTFTKTVNKKSVKIGIVTRAKVDKNHLASGDNPIAEMNIMVNATGWHMTDFSFEKKTDEEPETE